VSDEAILSAENSENSLGGHGSAPNHTRELTALP